MAKPPTALMMAASRVLWNSPVPLYTLAAFFIFLWSNYQMPLKHGSKSVYCLALVVILRKNISLVVHLQRGPPGTPPAPPPPNSRGGQRIRIRRNSALLGYCVLFNALTGATRAQPEDFTSSSVIFLLVVNSAYAKRCLQRCKT